MSARTVATAALAALPWLLLAACAEPEAAPSTYGTFRSSGGVLLDDQGRTVLLRGINARVEHIFDVTFDDGRTPLEKIPPLTEADCLFLGRDLGFNLLRLPVNWSGIEPQKGKYQEAYFKRVEAVVTACHRHGVYTLLDLHQDAWSKEIGEDGAPLWAIVPPPTKLLQGPLTDLQQRRLSAQVLAAFVSFFDNKQGLQEAYAAMAVTLARRFRDVPGVVGLELMNEPVLLTGEHKLDAFHLKVGRALRAAAPGLCIYFEPNSLRNMTDAAPVATPLPLENTVYAPHLYTGVFQSNWKQGDVARVRASVQKMRQEAAAHKAALMVGEFGNDPQTTPGRQWMTAALDQLDAAGASWALWLYEEWSQGSWGLYEAGPGHTRGALRQAFARQVARPFPTRLAGRLQKLAWDDKSRTLTVTFDGPLARPHVLSAPRLTYPDGVAVRCAGEAVTTSAPRPGRVAFECREGPVTMAPAR